MNANKIKEKIIKFVVFSILTVILGIVFYGAFWLDFKVWKLQHPEAPTWTYLLKGNK